MLDPRAVALLAAPARGRGRLSRCAPHTRRPSPATSARQPRAGETVSPGVGLPGFDGSGISIALLDTGVDRSQPYLDGRVEPGIDIVGGTPTAAPQRDPAATGRSIERHGTELAGILVGSGGPDGIHGVAPGATVLPIRVAGWQPGANGSDAIYARSDQLIAGLERAVDPNDDGDTHDAVRIALLGVAEPFASFADSPEALGDRRARAISTSSSSHRPVTTASPGRSSVRSGAPRGSPAALAVGATDSRAVSTSVRACLHPGALGRRATTSCRCSTPARRAARSSLAARRSRRQCLAEGQGGARAGGRKPASRRSSRAVADGAAAVLLYGRELPSGSLGDPGVPVVQVPARLGATAPRLTCRRVLDRGRVRAHDARSPTRRRAA